MFGVITNSWALLLGIGMLQIGNSLQGSLLGVRGKLEAFDASMMGYVMAAYFIGFMGGSMITPALIRRVGHVRVFAALGSMASAAFIIYAAVVDPFAWGVMRFVVGFCFSGIYVVAESWLNASATNETRGQALSAYLMIQMLGIVGGQFLLNVADPGGYDLFILMSVVLSLSFAPILLSAAPAPVFDSSERMSFGDLFRISPLGCIGTVVLGGVFSALFGMSAVYAGEKGFSVKDISIFIATIYVGAMMLQYPIGWLSDRMDRRTVIGFTAALGAAGCALGLVAGDSRIMILVAAALIGGAANPLYSLLIAHTNDFLSASKMASASSGLVFLNGMGASVGPIAVGYTMGVFGPDGFFIYLIALFALLTLYTAYRMTKRAAPEESGSYVAFGMRNTPVATEMAAEIYAEESEAVETEEGDDDDTRS